MTKKPIFLTALVTAVSIIILAACVPAASPSPAVPVTSATTTAAPASAAVGGADSASATLTTPVSKEAITGTLFTLVPAQSEASYSVREQLARRDLPSDAVGKTSGISGQVVINPDGSIDTTNSKFIVDVSTLQTDESMRDNFVRRNVLDTAKFPNAVFVPKQVTGLPANLPQTGDVTFKVTGDLTIRDQTKPVTWDVTGSVNNGVASGKATTSFTFEDFNLKQPQVPVVLSLVDKITLNVTVALQKSN